MKQVKVTVNNKAEVRIETSGYSGSECMDRTDKLKNKLGAVRDEELKPEYYEQQENTLEGEV